MLIEGELVEFEARQPRQVSSQIDERSRTGRAYRITMTRELVAVVRMSYAVPELAGRLRRRCASRLRRV